MDTVMYESFAREQITEELLDEASRLFSENYGIWGKDSGRAGSRQNPQFCFTANIFLGKPVKLGGKRLREQWLPESATTLYTRVIVDGQLAGHAFSCRWVCNGKNVCWITQLVVGKDYRRRGLAGTLLTLLRREEDDVFGIISSHPFACLAAVRAFGSTFAKINATLFQS